MTSSPSAPARLQSRLSGSSVFVCAGLALSKRWTLAVEVSHFQASWVLRCGLPQDLWRSRPDEVAASAADPSASRPGLGSAAGRAKRGARRVESVALQRRAQQQEPVPVSSKQWRQVAASKGGAVSKSSTISQTSGQLRAEAILECAPEGGGAHDTSRRPNWSRTASLMESRSSRVAVASHVLAQKSKLL